MGNLTRADRAAIECVARRFSATWAAASECSAGVRMTLDGRPITLEVLAMGHGKRPPRSRPRLRFDRVVLEIAGRLHTALDPHVPSDECLMITITAPILQPGKTAAVIVERVRGLLRGGSARVRLRATVYGNRIRAMGVTSVSTGAPRLVVLVHNPNSETDVPAALFGLMRALLERVAPSADAGAGRGSGHDRWLVLAPGEGLSHAPTLRQILTRIGIADAFDRILLVSPGGDVETLT